MTESLHMLLERVVDYAGLYPPASLPLPVVIANYERYLCSREAWMLNRVVLPYDKLSELQTREHWRITLLVDQEPGPLPREVETLETRSGIRLSLPTYCEVPLDRIETGYAKIRTANITTEALADFLFQTAARRLPFKATAGLHHPFRSASMQGFLNVFVGAVLAWSGMDYSALLTLLEDPDPGSFEFRDDGLRWRDWRAPMEQIAEARRDFAHSFGSCSFEEPVEDLRARGLLS